MSFTTQVIRNLGASHVLVGISTVIYMAASVIFAKMASAKDFNKRYAVPLIFTLMAIYCILVPISSQIWQIYLLQLFPAMASGILFAILTAEAMTQVPAEKKSTAMGYYQAIYAIGMTAFPALSGLLLNNISFTAAFTFLATTCLLAAISSTLYYLKTSNRPQI
jgi:predicted MFS family arabinose efflux permease